ncbi:MAG: type IX secretion system sortase PorU, partial [Bacteroidales bacterium]|nr:type IX secretion system sortase PorU [Bacteroidales bacterium]
MTYRITSIILTFFLAMQAWGATTSVHTWADSSALANGTWVKIALNQTYDGIYQITYSQLRSWGFSDPSQVAVYGYGGYTLSESLANDHADDLPEVATLHDAQEQRILFYGRGLTQWTYKDEKSRFVQRQHPYATYSCYFLHQKEGGEKPLAINIKPSNDEAQPVDTLTEYDEFWLHENELVNLGQTGRQWYGEDFLSSESQKFSLPETAPLKNHTLKAGSALLTVNFVTKTSATTSYEVRVNDKIVGTQNVGATTGSYTFGTEASFSKTVADSIHLTGAEVRVTYDKKSTSPTTARLNYIRLQGKCELVASAAEAFMLFRNAEAINRLAAYRIDSLTAEMQVWDVTSANEIFQLGLADGNVFVPEEKGLREYAVVNLASKAFPTVSRIGTLANQNLHGKPAANLVILTPTGLVQQAMALATYRLQHDGLTSIVVNPEAIYNEYSSGVADATAIRLYLKHLYDKEVDDDGNHTLRYLLLFGDGSYNNRAACKSSFMLPTYESEASLIETSSFVCDDYFGFLDDEEGGRVGGDGLYTLSTDKLDIGIGRLPVSSTEEAEAAVAKIIGYDTNQYGSWKNRLCFLADDDKIESSATDSPNLHMRHNDQLVKQLQDSGHNEFVFQKIYLPAYQQTTSASGTDYPDARKELNNSLQQGLLILNYAGHGSANNITHEQIMSAS